MSLISITYLRNPKALPQHPARKRRAFVTLDAHPSDASVRRPDCCGVEQSGSSAGS